MRRENMFQLRRHRNALGRSALPSSRQRAATIVAGDDVDAQSVARQAAIDGDVRPGCTGPRPDLKRRGICRR